MALVSGVLQAGFMKTFKSSKGMTPQKAAKQLAKVYDDYARSAMAGASIPAFTGLEAQKLEKVLFAAIATPAAGLPPILATAWATGVLAYWSAPPVVFAGPTGVGPVLQAFTVVPIITPGLTACFLNLANTEDLCATVMATILDAATRTVLVNLIPPSLTPVVVPLL